MAALSKVFFDTSVLVGGAIQLGEGSLACHRVLDAVAEGRLREPITAWHCCLELFSVLTRLPQEYRLDAADALRLLEEEVLARFEVLALPSQEQGPFLRRAVSEQATGGRIYDAHVGHVALAAGCSVVVTENLRHFRALARHGVEVLGAAELAARIG